MVDYQSLVKVSDVVFSLLASPVIAVVDEV